MWKCHMACLIWLAWLILIICVPMWKCHLACLIWLTWLILINMCPNVRVPHRSTSLIYVPHMLKNMNKLVSKATLQCIPTASSIVWSGGSCDTSRQGRWTPFIKKEVIPTNKKSSNIWRLWCTTIGPPNLMKLPIA